MRSQELQDELLSSKDAKVMIQLTNGQRHSIAYVSSQWDTRGDKILVIHCKPNRLKIVRRNLDEN